MFLFTVGCESDIVLLFRAGANDADIPIVQRVVRARRSLGVWGDSVTATDVRFAFGENWASFSEVVTDKRIENATECLQRLFPNGELKGSRFLDIGCGSGLSMLAALHLGADSVHGIDLDANSVATTRKLLGLHAPNKRWTVSHRSVFDLKDDEKFPVVYSWGVLHHTGDMNMAIKCAAGAVKPGGLFAVALYRKTALCGTWTGIKRFYAQAPSVAQSIMRGLYKAAFSAAMLKTGRNPIAYARGYAQYRGMSWSHDVHDWLGGYPYESASADEITATLKGLGFNIERTFVTPPGNGVFGTGCDEFVARLK